MPVPVVHRRGLGRWLLLLALGLIIIAASPGGAAAQIALKGTVNAPSTGNELTVEVSNVSAEVPVQGLSVALAGQPRYLTNVSILPERVPAVMPGQGVEITIRFDVRADAPAGQAETLALRVTAERGTTIDFPTPGLTVTFVKPPPPTAGSAAAPAAPPGAPRELKLVKIGMSEGRRYLGDPTDRTVYEYQEGQSGFVARDGGSVASVRVLRAPLEIPLDRPFEVEVEARWRGHLPPDHRCENPARRNHPRDPFPRASVGVWLGLTSDAELAASSRGPEDMQVFCRTTDEHYQEVWTPRPRPAATVDGLARVTLQVIPAKVEQTRRATVFHFRGAVSSTHGTVNRATLNPVPLLEWDPSAAPARLRVNVQAMWGRVLYLRYEGGQGAGPAVAALPPYEHPGDMRQPPRGDAVATAPPGAAATGGRAAATGPGGAGSPQAAGARPGAQGSQVASLPPGAGSPAPGATGAGVAPRPAPGGAPRPADPARLDPRSPEVAGLISQWIGVAEPPDNARGAWLRYDEWGRMIGTGVKREQITAGPRPDAAGGIAPTAYVWTLRDRLDSVNHCKLGEYVLSMIQGDSIARCQGRYAAPPLRVVASLAGLPAQEAEAKVRAQGLVPDLIGGDPPPSREREYTVQAQEPPAGSRLGEGERVALKIHSGYVDPRRPVPELRGVAVAEAERRLREMGFRAELTGGDPPQSRAGAYTVQAQDPPAGSPLGEGERVALRIHSGYVEPERPRVVAPQPPAGDRVPPQVRPAEAPSRTEPEICATYYSNLPDLGRGADRRMAQLAAQSAVAAGCDPQRVQQAVTGSLSPARPSSPPPPPPSPPAVSSQPPAQPAWPSARPGPAPPQGGSPGGGWGEPAACTNYYETLTELARADEGPNRAVARMTAQSALSAGCSPQRIQQALAAGAASPYSRRAAPAPPPSQPQVVPPRGGGAPTTGEPPVCAAHYARLAQWSRTYPGGSNHQAVQNEARKAVAAGCNRQRVEQILAQGRPPAPAPPPPRSPARPGTFPPPAQVPPGGSDRCPGGGSPILGQC